MEGKRDSDNRSRTGGKSLFSLQVAVAIVSIYFAVFAATMTASFETSDDAAMMAIVSGRLLADEPDPHLVFSHIAVGRALAWLYSQIPHWPWYGMYLMGAHFLGACGIAWAMLRPRVTPLRIGLLVAFLSIVHLYQLRYLQFTNAAATCVAASSVLAFSAFLHRPNGKIEPIALALASCLLLTIGMLIRAETLFLMVSVNATPWLALVVSSKRSTAGICSKATLLGIFATALLFGLRHMDCVAYEEDPAWQGFKRFNELRNRITDLGPDLGMPIDVVAKRRSANLAAAGWSMADFELLNTWLFLDAEKFNVERFERYLAGLPMVRTPRMIWRQITSRVLQLRTIPLAILLGACLWTTWRHRSSRAIGIAAVLGAVTTLVMLAALYKLERRLVWPILAFPAVLAVVALPIEASLGCNRRARCIAAALAVAACVLWPVEWVLAGRQRIANSEFRDDLANSRLGGDTLWVSCAGSLQTQCILPLEDHSYLNSVDCLMLGWPNRTPIAAKMLAKHGLSDPIASLVGRENVVLVAPPRNPTEVGQNRSQWIIDWVIPRLVKDATGLGTAYVTRFDGCRMRLLQIQGATSTRVERIESEIELAQPRLGKATRH